MINEPIIRQFAQEHLHNLVERDNNLFADCPVCHKGNNHFNISLDTGKWHCYKCGHGGSFERLTKKVLGWRVKVADVIEQYSGGITLATLLSVYDKESTVADLFFDWTEGTTSIFESKLVCQRALEYLATRNITRKDVEKLGFRVGVEGRYENMLVLPVYFDHEIANLVARQIKGYNTPTRYLYPHKGEAPKDKSELLYNYDNARKKDWVVLVEGVFDCIALMQIGIPSVALLGKEISDDQILLVLENWDKVIVLLDGGFEKDALKVARKLEGLTESIKIGIIEGNTDASEDVWSAVRAIRNASKLECF